MTQYQYLDLFLVTILVLALVAAGCGSAPQAVTQSKVEPTVTLSGPSTSTPAATAPPSRAPTASPTAPQPTPSPADAARPADTGLSAAASQIDPGEIITVLPRDAIPAILNPEFVTVEQAEKQMRDAEDVIGVSINGESRAYPVNMLSSHEIVNDTVGGVAIAVTW